MRAAALGFIFALPLAMIAFWVLNFSQGSTSNAPSLLSGIASYLFFAPWYMAFSLPALVFLLLWAQFLRTKLWPLSIPIASVTVVIAFALSTEVMCRINFTGPDCYGNIVYALESKSPSDSSYSLLFWSTAVAAAVFWLGIYWVNRHTSTAVARSES